MQGVIFVDGDCFERIGVRWWFGEMYGGFGRNGDGLAMRLGNAFGVSVGDLNVNEV